MKIVKLKILALFMAAMIIGGCGLQFGQPEDIEWNPDFAVPLFTTSITIQDLLDQLSDNDILQVDSDNLLTLVYNAPKISSGNINPLEINEFAFPILSNNQQAPTNFLSPIRLDILELNNGYFKYSAQNPFLEDINVTLTLNDLKINGTPMSVMFTIPAAASLVTPTEFADSVSVQSHILDLKDGNFETTYTATTASTSQNVNIPILVELKSLVYEYVEGYFGRDTFALDSGFITIGLFDNINLNGNITIEEPQVTFRTENQIGFPTRLIADSVIFSNTNNGTTTFLQNSDLNNGYDIAYPTLAERGQFKSSTLELNANNSNIGTIISQLPNQVQFTIDAILNPNENTNETNFYDKDFVLDLYVGVEIPVYGTASGFFTKDTFDFDISSSNTLERLGIKMIADNGLPLDIGLQGYFIDDFGNVVDSLFTEVFPEVIAAAPVDNDGIVTSVQETVTNIEFTEAQLVELRNRARHIIVETRINTNNGGSTPVKMLSTYELGLRMGIVVGL